MNEGFFLFFSKADTCFCLDTVGRERTFKEIASAIETRIDLDAPACNRALGYYARILGDVDMSKRAFDKILVEWEGFAFKVEVQ
jgi:hypothetical protein